MNKLLSRKFLLSVGAIISVVVSASQGAVQWSAAIPSIAAIVVGYCVSQGWVDGKALEGEIAKLSQGGTSDPGE
jgi:hypothetical protein